MWNDSNEAYDAFEIHHSREGSLARQTSDSFDLSDFVSTRDASDRNTKIWSANVPNDVPWFSEMFYHVVADATKYARSVSADSVLLLPVKGNELVMFSREDIRDEIAGIPVLIGARTRYNAHSRLLPYRKKSKSF